MAGKKLRFAVVGIGGIGRGHVQSALDAEEAELTAMCDPLGEEVKKTLVEFGLSDERLSGIPVYEDVAKGKIGRCGDLVTRYYALPIFRQGYGQRHQCDVRKAVGGIR